MKKFIAVVIFLLLPCTVASAATISFAPVNSSVAVNDIFDVDIFGSGFSAGLIVDGGGLDLTYDAVFLEVVSVVIDTSVWDAGLSNGGTDNGTGTVDNITFNKIFGSITESFAIGTITFKALAPVLSTDIGLLSEPTLPFVVGGSSLIPSFDVGTVSILVAVPLPGAFLLLLSGIGFIGFTRKLK